MNQNPLIILLWGLATAYLPAQTLQDYKGKHRLLVIPQPTAALHAELEKNQAMLSERHIKTIFLTPTQPRPIHREIASRFRLSAADSDIIFIGKDGQTSIRWTKETFTLKKLFQRIDAMPMRQREMRHPSIRAR